MINVLIVDDDPMVAELNKYYLSQVGGFHCQATVATLSQARALLADTSVSIDLVLLDIYMQQENGLDLLPGLRELGEKTDVIIISSASDVNTVQKALHYGVVDYLIKPFQFPRFEEALNGWKEKKQLMGSHQYYEQADVDRLLHGGAPELADSKRLPKGLTPQTLRTICQWIEAHPDTEFSTDDLANSVGISRVSCRKYLIWLAQINILFTSIHYGATGRPVYRYRLQPEQAGLLKQYCQ